MVEELSFEGTEAVDPDEIESRILTAETSWWNPFAEKKRFDPNVWRRDLKRIERYYQAQGFYQAQVVEADVREVEEDAVELKVRIDEGAPTRVSEVNLRGVDDLPFIAEMSVRSALQLQKGDVFLEEPWTTLPERLRAALVELGYAEADVSTNAQVDLAQKTAVLNIEVTPGVPYRIGGVNVIQKGDSKRVEEWRIREQAEEAIEDVQLYSEEAREEVQQQIFNMGVFGAVQVQPGDGNPSTGTIPLNIEVSEAPFHEVAYGLGIGFEQRRQEGHLISEYTHRDFLGGLRKLNLRLEAGWAFIPSIYTVARQGDAVLKSGPIAQLQAELEQPRLFHPNLRLNTRTEIQKEIEPAYSYVGGRLRVGVPWRPRSYLVLEPSYNLELYRLSQGEIGLRGDAPDLLFGCQETCVLSFLEERIAWDRRDDPQEPTRGYYLALALQQGGGPFGGSFDYLRILPEARAYKSFLRGRRLTLGARVRVGTLIPLGGERDESTPIVARFFSGGDQMRGFSAQRLSPMALTRKSNLDPDDTSAINAEPVPIGGNGLFETSFEARYRISRPITLAAFVDAGFVTQDHRLRTPTRSFFENILVAVGPGIRYRTPVGPIRLDLAYRLPIGPPLEVEIPGAQDLRYVPSSGCFGIGKTSGAYAGAPEGLCSIHLSIGEAF